MILNEKLSIVVIGSVLWHDVTHQLKIAGLYTRGINLQWSRDSIPLQ